MKPVDTFIALNRFGLGAKPGEPGIVGADPRGWVRRQIVRERETPASLGRFPDSASILRDIHKARLADPKTLRQVVGRYYREAFGPELRTRARHMIATNTPFAERMVLFWSNHFTVSRSKAIIGPAIPAYEREAIRPHVFGRFEDMLAAVVGHPVMISYLDNSFSTGPNSLAGRRSGRSLNENLAREILELHTLGVNGGYAQSDVTEMARILTGWTHGGALGRRSPVTGGFVFRDARHEPGPKTVLGRTYREDGVEAGRTVLRDLARHPSTARFVAAKLARHFVSDDPPGQAIERIEHVFRETEGDLSAVSRALVDLEAVWENPLPKVKSPYELVISTHRALGAVNRPPRSLRRVLRSMGQDPFAARSPQGWPDTGESWIGPQALMRRIEWLRATAAGHSTAVKPAVLLERLIGPVASAETRRMVELAPSGDTAVALVLASAEFQRR